MGGGEPACFQVFLFDILGLYVQRPRILKIGRVIPRLEHFDAGAGPISDYR